MKQGNSIVFRFKIFLRIFFKPSSHWTFSFFSSQKILKHMTSQKKSEYPFLNLSPYCLPNFLSETREFNSFDFSFFSYLILGEEKGDSKQQCEIDKEKYVTTSTFWFILMFFFGRCYRQPSHNVSEGKGMTALLLEVINWLNCYNFYKKYQNCFKKPSKLL